MKTLLTFVTLMLLTGQSLAALKCHTPRHNQEFTIKKSTVAFHQEGGEGRKVASEHRTYTRLQGDGFTKRMKHLGMDYTIHIKNKNVPSHIEDYLIIKSRQGHEIIYPLYCEQV